MAKSENRAGARFLVYGHSVLSYVVWFSHWTRAAAAAAAAASPAMRGGSMGYARWSWEEFIVRASEGVLMI